VTESLLSDAAAVEERFLAHLRRRVSWQAEQAAREREQALMAQAGLDLLDPVALAALLERRADDLRTPERRALLAELEVLIEDDGRLPADLEEPIRLVFSDLL
jgi:hypothetical protein